MTRPATVPIDDNARDGALQLVFTGSADAPLQFALVAWNDGQWIFPNGATLEPAPTHYRPREVQ